MTPAERDQLAADFERAHGRYGPWEFEYLYPGWFMYALPHGATEVYFTPEFEKEGVVDIQVHPHSDGEERPFDEPLTAQQLFRIVKPWLDRYARPSAGRARVPGYQPNLVHSERAYEVAVAQKLDPRREIRDANDAAWVARFTSSNPFVPKHDSVEAMLVEGARLAMEGDERLPKFSGPQASELGYEQYWAEVSRLASRSKHRSAVEAWHDYLMGHAASGMDKPHPFLQVRFRQADILRHTAHLEALGREYGLMAGWRLPQLVINAASWAMAADVADQAYSVVAPYAPNPVLPGWQPWSKHPRDTEALQQMRARVREKLDEWLDASTDDVPPSLEALILDALPAEQHDAYQDWAREYADGTLSDADADWFERRLREHVASAPEEDLRGYLYLPRAP